MPLLPADLIQPWLQRNLRITIHTTRELQYAGLVEIQKQGCGKPNRIFPKSYEAVPNTDFKKSGSGTPEG